MPVFPWRQRTCPQMITTLAKRLSLSQNCGMMGKNRPRCHMWRAPEAPCVCVYCYIRQWADQHNKDILHLFFARSPACGTVRVHEWHASGNVPVEFYLWQQTAPVSCHIHKQWRFMSESESTTAPTACLATCVHKELVKALRASVLIAELGKWPDTCHPAPSVLCRSGTWILLFSCVGDL